MIGAMDGRKEENAPYFQLRRIGRPATMSGVRDVMRLGPLVTKFGRHSKNDFYLNSQVLENFISRWHAEIHVVHDGNSRKYMLADKSLNGTYVNNVRVKGHHFLQEGDIVAFGHKNGKNVQPGQVAPQDPSEFFFMFEKVVPHDSDYQSDSEEPVSPEQEVPQADQDVTSGDGHRSRNKQLTGEAVLRDISNGGSTQENETVGSSSSEDDVISGAVAAASKFDSDDDDEFDTQPQTSSRNTAQQSSASLLSFLKPPTNKEASSGQKKKSSGSKASATVSSPSSSSNRGVTMSQVFRGPNGWSAGSSPTSSKHTAAKSKSSTEITNKNSKRKWNSTTATASSTRTKNSSTTKAGPGRKRKSQGDDEDKPKKKRSRKKTESDDEEDEDAYHYAGDPCEAPHCILPKASKVSWVQCDDCDKWYHTVCVGCSIDDVEGDAEFRCGCT